MASMSDKTFGGMMLFIAAAVFLYYTLWTILIPFFDASSPIQGWFPSKEWAVRIPTFILVLGISTIGFFLGRKIVSSHQNNFEPQREVLSKLIVHAGQ